MWSEPIRQIKSILGKVVGLHPGFDAVVIYGIILLTVFLYIITQSRASMDFGRMNIGLLAEECSNETKKYFRGVPNEARYCFELLCRACRDGIELALTYIYKIYLPLLSARARRHGAFPRSSQDSDSIARIALSKFYLATKGEKFLQKFSTTAQAIAYMYTCVHTAVLEDVDNSPELGIDQEIDIPSPETYSGIELQQLWSHICSLLSEDQQFLANLRFVLDMKPAEIVQFYPQKWDTPRKVSVALQDIRRRLRSDSDLQGLLGKDEDD